MRTYTDTQIDRLLDKAEAAGLIPSWKIVATFEQSQQEKYRQGIRAAMREVLAELPDPEGLRVVYGVIAQPWWEKERGWGERPDGFTMHASEEDRKAFIQAYWDRMPDAVPDEYSAPIGDPYVIEVDLDTYEKVCTDERKGLWGHGNKAPEPAKRRDLQVGENTL